MKPKRFVVFGYDDYYPGGGWGDLRGSADTVEGAWEIAKKEHADLFTDNWEVIDLETGDVCQPENVHWQIDRRWPR